MNTKKTSLITAIALATAAFAFTPGRSEAGDFKISINRSNCNQPRVSLSYGSSHHKQSYCAPQPRHCESYKVCTKEVSRFCEQRYSLDHCGRRISFHVTVVVYRDIYSDGHFVTYQREFRA